MNSIRLRLTLAFILVCTLTGLAGGGIAFLDTYRETHKLQDDLLRQISAYVSPAHPPAQRQNSDNDARIAVYVLNGKSSSVIRLPEHAPAGFYNFAKDDDDRFTVLATHRQAFFDDLKHAGDLYRAYVRPTAHGHIVVMQENEYREELAERAAWTGFLPLLVLLPVLSLLTFVIVRRTMRPIVRLAEKVGQRSPQDLTPLSLQGIPSEAKQFVLAINGLLAQTDRFVQQQKRFIADAAHELRSPMTALSLQAERLNQQELPEAARRQSEMLITGIRRSRDLLEQLLSLARIQNPAATPRSRVDIHAVFGRVIEDLFPLAEQKQHDLGVVSDRSAHIHANETDIYLLVKTLTDNAVRYTPAGSRIDLSVQQHPDHLLICVEDNGKGIPAAEHRRVFDPFYRILGSDEQGSGLGLAIARSIADNYGGSITLSDSPHFDSGLLVSVRLPI